MIPFLCRLCIHTRIVYIYCCVYVFSVCVSLFICMCVCMISLCVFVCRRLLMRFCVCVYVCVGGQGRYGAGAAATGYHTRGRHGTQVESCSFRANVYIYISVYVYIYVCVTHTSHCPPLAYLYLSDSHPCPLCCRCVVLVQSQSGARVGAPATRGT